MSENKNTGRAIQLLELCKDRIPSSDLYSYLGIAYQYVNNREEALQNYVFATYMVPNLLAPKYYLFTLYKETGQDVLAEAIGRKILSQKVKVNSRKTIDIKRKVSAFIQKKQ